VLLWRKVALPANSSPSSFRSRIHAVTVPTKTQAQELNYAFAAP
jgi:hypothetical protein